MMTYDEMLEAFDRATEAMPEPTRDGATDAPYTLERALLALLRGDADTIRPHWEETGQAGCLQGFHKGFRQIDVTGSGYRDMAIWHLLNGSRIWWRVVNPKGE